MISGLSIFALLTLPAAVVCQGKGVPGFVTPRLPFTNEGRKYPQCVVEIVFLLDVSNSILSDNSGSNDRLKSRQFVSKFISEVDKSVLFGR